MLWDPMKAWPAGRWWIWAGLAAVACSFQGPVFLRTLTHPAWQCRDFFQDWASARNWFEGLPVYTRHEVTLPRYLGYPVDETMSLLSGVNAHPPTSVVLALPLAHLDYSDALLAWNLLSLPALMASLWIVQRQLRIPCSLLSLFPAVFLILACNSLRQQNNYGQ